MNTYMLCKNIIEKGNCVKEDMLAKLDTFLLVERLKQEQYVELVGLLK